MTESKQIIADFLKENPKYFLSDQAYVAEKFGVSVNVIQKLVRDLKLIPEYRTVIDLEKSANTIHEKDIDRPEPEPTLPKHDILRKREEEKRKEAERKYNILLGDYQRLDEAYDVLFGASDQEYKSEPIITGNPDIKGEATAVALWSDFHLSEKVELGTSGGMNETNPEIMRARVEKLAINTVKLINKERHDSVINDLVIGLLGDFMNSYLHDWDVQMNYMSPMEELVFARDLLADAIQYVLDHGDLKRVTCVCQRGNHGRITFKMSSSTDYKMNYEAVLYNMLKKHFANDERIEFHIPESQVGYIQIYDKTIRYYHGHEARYSQGIGGLTIPLSKLLLRWDYNRRADQNWMAHYHQFSMPTGNTLLNGSLIGFNSYALSLGMPYQDPLQTFQLIDKKHGFVTRMPIFCK